MPDQNPMAGWGEAAKKLLGDDFWNSITSQMNMGTGGSQVPFAASNPYPLVDVVESEQEVLVLVDLPGIRHPQSVDVYVEGDLLFIKGDYEHFLPSGEIKQQERKRGSFERSIALHAQVQKDAIRARYEHGVLEIKLPKVKQKYSRTRIPIDF